MSRRQSLLYVIAVSIPLLFFVLFELGLRYFDYGDSLELFIPDLSARDQPHWVTNPIVARRYFPKIGYLPRPRYESFLQEKTENVYRVFVLGGSTAASWPYPSNVSFSRILRQRLADTFPDKNIEVVNTAIAAVNSFTLLDFMDEILDQKPDAILIYAGHNEFYGALGAASSQTVGQSRWLIKTYLALLKFKTVQLIRDLVNVIRNQSVSGSNQQYSTLMGQMVRESHIALDSEAYQTAKANYEANLREILSRSQKAGVPVLLSELVSNLRDPPPFVSLNGKDGQTAADLYVKARALDQAQQYEEAKQIYRQARALDGLRFRAPEEFNVVIHNIAAEFSVPVVPMLSYFENASPQGIMGSNLILEHLHPNVGGYFLMSEAFFDAMYQQAFVSENWVADNILPADYYRRTWPITNIDRALGEIAIIDLTDHWPYPSKKKGERTLAGFIPGSEAETLAYKNFLEEISYKDAHIQMAEYYTARGEHEEALREYLALISASPHDISYHLLTISKLLKQKAYERALPLLLASRKVKETLYANKWIGQIYLMRGQPRRAQAFLERAITLKPDDMLVVYGLGVSYFYLGQREAAAENLKQLRLVEPGSARTKKLEGLLRE